MLKFILFGRSLCITLLFLGFFCSPAFSTTLTLASGVILDISETGELMGADHIEVLDDVYYDVTFVDASALRLFYNQSSGYTFAFTTAESASAAAQSLLDLVFVDIDPYKFDSIPELTNGIESTRYGWIITPYATSISSIYELSACVAINGSLEIKDRVAVGTLFHAVDDMSSDEKVYAVWVRSNTSPPLTTPEPTTILLFGSGLIGLAGLSRKKYFNKA